ncbi:MAG: hypothetical protein HY744_10745 [Deltaproteobacteria bacterium]|nr:hypothetical protein [Deltaproteobacteria bacterium]
MPPARALALLASAGALAALGCTQEPTILSLRALQSSGPVSFVCLGAPADSLAEIGLPLGDCSASRTLTPDDYSIPHLYALVTQPIRGEVAVVDLTTSSSAVIDQNPAVPGANLLPVGALPADIVSTPGGVASFVASAEPGHEGIYALPSDLIRGSAARLTSWPGCALPASPAEIELVLDPADDQGRLRPSCDAAYGEAASEDACGPGADCGTALAQDAENAGKPGRYKLLVTLPSEGGFAVIDAQGLLDRAPGSFGACALERWVPLAVDLPALRPPEPPVSDGACAVPETLPDGPFAASYAARPGGMAQGDGRLYVADRAAPVVHVVSLPTPCEPLEEPPLVALSAEDPGRTVTTSRVALSPLTLDLKQYLYAIDIVDGSIMVFDVSADSASRVPLQRSDPANNPFQPLDRIRYNATPREIVVVQHESPEHDSTTGAGIPVRCDPDPTSEGPGTVYQTSAGYDSGAGPTRLRGVFAFAVLSTGAVAVIDVDDYDAPCRGPRERDPLYGCAPDDEQSGLATSGEYTCHAVTPQQTRAAGYLIQAEGVANNQPGVQTLPVLFDPEGMVLTPGDDTAEGRAVPRMRATVPAKAPPHFTLAVGTGLRDLDPPSGQLLGAGGKPDPTAHALAMNLEDPRAHLVNQNWTVTYEGALPGFAGHFAALDTEGAGGFVLRDIGSRFCDRGVHSEQAVRAALLARGLAPAPAAALARVRADYVQIFSSLPAPSNAYWSQQSYCTHAACKNELGSTEVPTQARDLRVVEAYEDRLSLVPRAGASGAGAPQLKCCFPGVVEFAVRAGTQWVVVGDAVGFLHHVIADPQSGACRDNCDPALVRRSGRVLEVPQGELVTDGDPDAFLGAYFRFRIEQGCRGAGDCQTSARAAQFRFATQGAFRPLVLSTVVRDPNVQPQAAQYLAPTGELVVSDGSLDGITFLNLSTLGVSRQYN